MVPRIIQPIILILIIGSLVLLRLAPRFDPLQRVLRGQVESTTPGLDSEDNRISQLEAENKRLRQELGFSDSQAEYVRADVLGKTVASFREAVRIRAGSRHGLQPDQPVLSDGHLVGRVGTVEDSLATVLLLGDPDIRIPVVIGRAQGIVLPQAGGLIIDQVVGEVSAGEPVLTSGIDGIYPPGLLVGAVGDSLKRDIFGRFVLRTPLDITHLSFVSVQVGER